MTGLLPSMEERMSYKVDIGSALKYLELHKNEYLRHLKELIRIPSISFPGFAPSTLRKSAEYVAELLKKTGLNNVRLLDTPGHPSVFGEWIGADGAPTVLLYAHHDVQPIGREDIWTTPAFEPSERDGRLYGRGASDDKGGILIHAAAIEAYMKAVGSLPVNVKVLIEGEEEIGSTHLNHILSRHSDLLKSDIVIIADSENFDSGQPSLTVSLRGIVTINIEVKALRSSVHSGTWGGPLPDPVIALSKMIAGIVDDDGRPAIPRLMDKLRKPGPRQMESLEGLPYDERKYRSQSGLLDGVWIIGGSGSVYEKMWYRPSISVNAIEAGSRKHAANIINDKAWARLGIRTVQDMDPNETVELLKRHLLDNAPWGVKVEIEPESPSDWWLAEMKGPVFDAALAALEEGYGRKPHVVGAGGSVPFVRTITEMLGGVPALLIGVGDPYSAAHSENESLLLSDWEKAAKALIHLFYRLGRLTSGGFTA